MKRPFPTLAALALLTAASSPAGAQVPDAYDAPDAGAREQATTLDTLTVMGTRTEVSVQDNPVSVSVVDRYATEHQAADSIAELLRDLPGVSIVDATMPGMKRIRMRGESSRRVTVLVDGQEITDHSTYGTPIPIDPSNVERIEVLRGSASVLYGGKAIGGVINIITRRGAPVPFELEAGGSLYTGSDGWQGWLAPSGTLGDFDYRLTVSMDRHHDREVPKNRYSSTGTLDNTSFHNGDVALHLGRRFGERGNHYLALKANRHWLDTEAWSDPTSYEYPVTAFGIEMPRRDMDKVGLQYDASDLGPVLRKLHVDAYHQNVARLFGNRVTMQPTPMVNVGITSTSDDDNLNYGGTAQFDLQLGPSHYAIAGVHYLMDDLDTDKSTVTRSAIGPRPPTVQTEWRRDRASLRTVSAFMQDEWSIAPTVKLTGGARWYHVTSALDESSEAIRPDQRSRTTADWVTSLGSTWAVAEGTTLRALYSEGYIMPTLLQLFSDNSAGRGTLTYANPELAPETSRNIELGARYHRDGLQLDLAIYHTRARDFITSQECGAGSSSPCLDHAIPGSFIYVNADRATSRGIELMAEYALQDSAFTVYGSAAWAQRRLELALLAQDIADSSLPRLTGRVGLRYDDIFSRHDAWADLFVRAATHSRQILVADGSNTHALHGQHFSGWGTLNLSAGVALGAQRRQKLGLHLENLFDRSYRTSVDELPAMGRSAVVSFQLAF